GSARNGRTPRPMYGSSTVNVAPSRPISSVGPTSHLHVIRVAVHAHEHRELRDGQVALIHRALSDLLEVLRKRQPSELLLDHRREAHHVERLETAVGDEPRLRPDIARKLPVALRLIEEREDSLQHMWIDSPRDSWIDSVQHLWIRHGHRVASPAPESKDESAEDES